MSKDFPGPYANLAHPTGNDAIYASLNAGLPHGSGNINYVNPSGVSSGANKQAIFDGFNAGGPGTLPPDYVAPQSLADSCAAATAWWAQTHGSNPKGPKGDPSKDKHHG